MTRKRSIAVPPGETIKEQMADKGISLPELARCMGMAEKSTEDIIAGTAELTPEVAERLEMVLGVPAQFWNNLESIYRRKKREADKMNERERTPTTLYGLINEIADDICNHYCKFAKENETDEEYDQRMADHCCTCHLVEKL